MGASRRTGNDGVLSRWNFRVKYPSRAECRDVNCAAPTGTREEVARRLAVTRGGFTPQGSPPGDRVTANRSRRKIFRERRGERLLDRHRSGETTAARSLRGKFVGIKFPSESSRIVYFPHVLPNRSSPCLHNLIFITTSVLSAGIDLSRGEGKERNITGATGRSAAGVQQVM